jgi:predicted MPP superfamily phosphohydrolase
VSQHGQELGAGGRARAWPYFALLVWVQMGYTAALRFVVGLPWLTSFWQGALCLAASAPLLLIVIKVVSLPKSLRTLPRPAFVALGAGAFLAQFALPWVGWTALLYALNGGHLGLMDAVAGGSGVAWFSYVTGLALVAALHPRACDVEVTHHDVEITGLPPAYDGYRILHVSDLHGGIFLSTRSVEARLASAMGIHADLVAFTGDLASRAAGGVNALAALLAGLGSNDGTVAVLGNHDHWIGEERVASALSDRGIAVLRNAHMTLERDGEVLHVAGVSDASYIHADDLAAAFDGIPDGAPVILLSHAPEIIHREGAERAALILSGHTHGGQVVLPWLGPVYVPSQIGRNRASGLHRIGGHILFVNRGLGEVFPPVRVNCPPEIAVLTLRSAPPLG